MLVVLEGPDGAGITTFKDDLKKRLLGINPNFKIVDTHNGPYDTPDDAYLAFLNQLVAVEEDRHNQMIFFLDRCHISERIYSEVFRETKIDDDRYESLDLRMRKLAPILILCLPPMEVAMTNWEDSKEEMFRDKLQYIQVYRKYEKFRDYTKCLYRKYDYTSDENNAFELY